MSRSATRTLAIVILVLVALFGARGAEAHEVNFSRGDYRASPGGAEAWFAFARPDFIAIVPELDIDGDGKLQEVEIASSAAVDERLLSLVTADRGGIACRGSIIQVAPTDQDGGLFAIRFGPCEGNAATLTIHIGALLSAVASGHRHTAFVHVEGEPKPRDSIQYGPKAKLEVPVGAAVDAPAAPPAQPGGSGSIASSSFRAGLTRMWTGADHLVFLLGLVLLGRRARDLGATILAFTVAHSLGLGLALAGTIPLRASVIGPLVALSVAYVGFENFVVKDPSKRWRLGAAFGLIHGLSFAVWGAQKLPNQHRVLAIGSFNLGIEVAQLVVLAALLPALARLRRVNGFETRGVELTSVAVIAAGLFWFAQRTFFS